MAVQLHLRPLYGRFVNGTLSDFVPATRGYPQGSALGPFVFLIYFNTWQRLSLLGALSSLMIPRYSFLVPV